MVIAKKKFQRFGPIYRDPIPRFPVAARQRSLLTDIDLSNSTIPRGDQVLAEGDNYRFTWDGDLYVFNLRDESGNAYRLIIVGPAGAEEYQLQANVDPVVVGIVPNFGAYYQFTTDNYFRLFNPDTPSGIAWHTISADLDLTELISDPFASMALVTTDSNTFNALFTSIYTPGTPSFFFRYIPTGALYKPWVVIENNNPMIRLTLQ